jgi:hypothetical protein
MVSQLSYNKSGHWPWQSQIWYIISLIRDRNKTNAGFWTSSKISNPAEQIEHTDREKYEPQAQYTTTIIFWFLFRVETSCICTGNEELYSTLKEGRYLSRLRSDEGLTSETSVSNTRLYYTVFNLYKSFFVCGWFNFHLSLRMWEGKQLICL